MLYKQAVKDFVSLETLGQTALLMASDHASTLTGIAMPVDGGWNAQ
jgi:3-hydroxybutyrate dehydrogenase